MIPYETEVLGGPAVSLSEVRDYLRAYDPEDGPMLQSITDAATDFVESCIEKAIRETLVTAYPDKLSSTVELPFGNVLSIESVFYTAPDGQEQELTGGFRLLKGTPSALFVASPPNQAQVKQGARITYKAGFDCAPEKYKQAIKVVAADLFENRERQIVGASVAVNSTVERLLNQLREFGL